MNLCEYKNIFGKPKTGVHSLRIFNIAIVDVLLTVLAALIFSVWFKVKFWKVLIFLFILGIGMHYLFCVKTTIHTLIFGKVSQKNCKKTNLDF